MLLFYKKDSGGEPVISELMSLNCFVGKVTAPIPFADQIVGEELAIYAHALEKEYFGVGNFPDRISSRGVTAVKRGQCTQNGIFLYELSFNFTLGNVAFLAVSCVPGSVMAVHAGTRGAGRRISYISGYPHLKIAVDRLFGELNMPVERCDWLAYD